jgi:hypothetical protein
LDRPNEKILGSKATSTIKQATNQQTFLTQVLHVLLEEAFDKGSHHGRLQFFNRIGPNLFCSSIDAAVAAEITAIREIYVSIFVAIGFVVITVSKQESDLEE